MKYWLMPEIDVEILNDPKDIVTTSDPYGAEPDYWNLVIDS